MNIKNKFLFVMIVGVVGLIATTFWIIQNTSEITYQQNNTPEAVTSDFLIAISQQDYEIAYGLISAQIDNYPPSVEDFQYDVQTNLWIDDSFDSFEIEEIILGSEEATVAVSLIEFYQGDLFNSGENTYVDQFFLRLEKGQWKIYDSQYFFPYCWNGTENCSER